MKPAVKRVASVPLTTLVCCPQCYCLISYEAGQPTVACHTCGTIVRGRDLPSSLDSSVNQD
ncbi:MAG: hypothetical protein HY581_06025 [Nitrospirae bacterium]|nr:hypothetical protein [Nitrospirota bacterium]